MKYRANASEPFQELYIKALDSMPVGTMVDFDGQASDIPTGWEQVSDDKNITTANIVNGTLTSANLDIRNINNELLKFYGTIVFSSSYQISQVDIATGYQIVSTSKTLKNIAIIQDMNDNDVKIVANGTLNTDGTINILVNPSVSGHSYKICFLDSEIDTNTIIIKKTSETTPTMASIVNAKNNSTTDGYSCDFINKLHTYSADEHRVGTFVDGKPIYRKTIYIPGNLTYDVNGEAYVNTNITNIDVLINFTGQVYDSTSGHLPLPYINVGRIDYGLAMSMQNDNRILIVNKAYDNPRLSKFVFNLEYTKTTD